MSATDELRALLDDAGVEWYQGSQAGWYETEWINTYGTHSSSMEWHPTLTVILSGLTPAQAVEATLGPSVTGETSDGYHTFDELYHHRAVLFSVIVRMMPDKAWKSKLHHDGTMYDGMFIVGIETSAGQATYHYDIDPYWGMFDCEELERAPVWDGHTPSQAIERIATLGRGECHIEEDEDTGFLCCSECGAVQPDDYTVYYCWCCGAKVVSE